MKQKKKKNETAVINDDETKKKYFKILTLTWPIHRQFILNGKKIKVGEKMVQKKFYKKKTHYEKLNWKKNLNKYTRKQKIYNIKCLL